MFSHFRLMSDHIIARCLTIILTGRLPVLFRQVRVNVVSLSGQNTGAAVIPG
ncbi:MAG: hypothetical protein R3E79_17245 [Caldilineaceae bacterium]